MPGRNCSTVDCATWTCLFCSILCCYWTCLSVLALDVSVLQQAVLPGRNCCTAAFSILNTNFDRTLNMRKIFLYPCWNFRKNDDFCRNVFAKMEKAFCFSPNTDPGLFGRKAVLGIRDILVRIRIHGSVPLTNGSRSNSGSGSDQWLKNLIYLLKIFC